MAQILGAGWGVVIAFGISRTWARIAARAAGWNGAASHIPVMRVLTGTRARRDARRLERRRAVELPVLVDLVAMGLAAGCPPPLAFDLAVPWSPPTIRAAVRAVTGRDASFATALTAAGTRDPAVRRVADALLVSERTGAPVGPALTRLGDQLRTDARRRAETRARAVPIRLLFPLVFLVLPAFVLLTVVPAISVAFTR